MGIGGKEVRGGFKGVRFIRNISNIKVIRRVIEDLLLS
jgi:hypothetical protein